MLHQRQYEHQHEKGKRAAEQAWQGLIGTLAHLARTLADQPGGTQQRITQAKANAAEQGERIEPFERGSRISAVDQRKAHDQLSYRDTLQERRRRRAAGERQIPQPAHPYRLCAEFECHAPEDQTPDHERQRQIESGEQG